jgi:undecaprenyl-diphosphatase
VFAGARAYLYESHQLRDRKGCRLLPTLHCRRLCQISFDLPIPFPFAERTMPPQTNRLKSFLLRRLSPEGYLGLHLTIGVMLLIIASWLFAGIAEDVVSAEAITILDVRFTVWLHSHAAPSLTRFMLMVSYLHGTVAMTGYVALLGIVFIRKRNWYWLTLLLVTVPVGMLLNVVMKTAFHRARPIFDHPLLTLSTYSFPSGHAEGATLFYGVLAACLFSYARPWHWRAGIVVTAAIMTALVGFSRIYLGVHYLSDVLAGVVEGIAWLALCLTAAASWRKHRALSSLPSGTVLPHE